MAKKKDWVWLTVDKPAFGGLSVGVWPAGAELELPDDRLYWDDKKQRYMPLELDVDDMKLLFGSQIKLKAGIIKKVKITIEEVEE